MRKQQLLGIGIILVAMLLGGLAFWMMLPHLTSTNPSKLTIRSSDPDFASTSPTHVATSTVTYMRPGRATTTLSCPTDGIDDFDLRIKTTASSTLTNPRG